VSEARKWLRLYSGSLVNPRNVQAIDVRCDDLAHHMALVDALGGTSPRPYSLAERALMAVCLVEGHWCKTDRQKSEHVQAVLLHEAPAVYCGFVPLALRESLDGYLFRDAWDKASAAIERALGLQLGLLSSDRVVAVHAIARSIEQDALTAWRSGGRGPADSFSPIEFAHRKGLCGKDAPLWPERVKAATDWQKLQQVFADALGRLPPMDPSVLHYHHCPCCYEHVPCTEDCAIHDRDEAPVLFGATVRCDDCAAKGLTPEG
jgi:hypothetical protein